MYATVAATAGTFEMSEPSFKAVVNFVKAFTFTHRPITSDTRLEAHLGITGENGIKLIQAAETHFNIPLASPEEGIRQTFRLGPNEYLFHPTDSERPKLGAWLSRLRQEPQPIFRDLTVGELHQALLRAARAHPKKSQG